MVGFFGKKRGLGEMIKVVLKCAKCGKTTLGSENQGEFELDFMSQTISFFCPKCNHANYLNLGKIQSEIKRQTKLPGIGISRT